jgi:hypothetical protein
MEENEMNYSLAFGSGMAAGVVLSALLGVNLDLAMLISTFNGTLPGVAAWILGYTAFLIITGLIGLLYGLGFEKLNRFDWKTGVGFSVIHLVIVGLLLGVLPLIHPGVPEIIPAPGIFAANKGLFGIIGFVVAHLIFGAIVGALYRPLQYTRPTAGHSIGIG